MELNRYWLVRDTAAEFISHGVFIVGMTDDCTNTLHSWLEWNDPDGPRSYREACFPAGSWVGPATAARKQLVFHIGRPTAEKYLLIKNTERLT